MRAKQIAGVVCLAMVLSNVLYGQETVSPGSMPSPPYLKSAPAMSSWTIDYGDSSKPVASTDGTGTGGTPLRIRQIDVVKTNKLRRVTVTYASGERTDLWSNGEAFIQKEFQNPPTLIGITVRANTLFEEYIRNDFPDFSWVSKENFVRTTVVDGRSYLVFSRKGERILVPNDMIKEEHAPPDDQELVTVVIDAATRLPVQWSKGKEVRKVIFNTPPSTQVAFPPEIQTILNQVNKLNQITSSKAPSGGY